MILKNTVLILRKLYFLVSHVGYVHHNVKIIFDDKTAISQRAVYTTDSRILVLTGPDSKIISGKDSISGEKITLYRADDRIIVESGKEKQVEAVFFSKQGGLN